jgi:hypothetical protein
MAMASDNETRNRLHSRATRPDLGAREAEGGRAPGATRMKRPLDCLDCLSLGTARGLDTLPHMSPSAVWRRHIHHHTVDSDVLVGR